MGFESCYPLGMDRTRLELFLMGFLGGAAFLLFWTLVGLVLAWWITPSYEKLSP